MVKLLFSIRNIKIPRKSNILYHSRYDLLLFKFEKVVLLFLILQQAKSISYLYYLNLSYIYRLIGVALLAPMINYWWQGIPPNLSTEAYYKQLPQDQWVIRIVHYFPWLTYLWNTQKWFPAFSAVPGNTKIFSRQDLEILSKKVERPGIQINKVLESFLLYFFFYIYLI